MVALPSFNIGKTLKSWKVAGGSLLPRAALVATLALESDQSPDIKIAAPVRDTYAECTPNNYAGATSITVDHTKSLLSYKLETGQEARCDKLTEVEMRAQLLEILNSVDQRYHPGEPKLTNEEAVQIINELGETRKNEALTALGILIVSVIPLFAWASFNKKQLDALWQVLEATSPEKLSRFKKLLLAPKVARENPAILKKIILSYAVFFGISTIEASVSVPQIHSLLAGGMGLVEIHAALNESKPNGTLEAQDITAMRAGLEHARVEKTPLF